MQYLWMALFTAGIVGLDQFTKYLTVANIPLHTEIPAIPGLFHLTYVQNTGAAFSSFEGQIWLFVIVFAVFTGAILWSFPASAGPLRIWSDGSSWPSTAAVWAT